MKIVTQFAAYKVVTTNTLERPFLGAKNREFAKVWIYPGTYTAGNSILTPNANRIYIGEVSDGAGICLDYMDPTDLPIGIELPAGLTKNLEDLCVYGTANDGIYVKFWPAWQPVLTQFQRGIQTALSDLNSGLAALRSVPPSKT